METDKNKYSLALDEIIIKRRNIEEILSKSIKCVFNVNSTPEKVTKELKELKKVLDEVYSYNSNVIQELVGGELNKDVIYDDNDQYQSSFPLYFLLYVILEAVSVLHLDKFYDKQEILGIQAELKKIEFKAEELGYSALFDPKEVITIEALDYIVKSEGIFRNTIAEDCGVKFLGITLADKYKEYRVGDQKYYEEYLDFQLLKAPKPLYVKDKLKINEKINEKNKKLSEMYHNMLKKYFVDGVMPYASEFAFKLKNKNLDDRILLILYSMSLIKTEGHDDYNFYITLKDKILEIKSIEETIKLDEQKRMLEQRNLSIDEAKKRYNNKSFFWKIYNKKMNPENLDFDNMSTENIDGLYMRK